MKKKRSPIVPILIALAIGLLVIILLNNVIRPMPVVVAKVSISPGTVLIEDLLEVHTVPAQARPRDAYAKIEEVTGKMLAVGRAPSDLITLSVLGEEAQTGIPSQLAEGHVAVAVQVDMASGVGGLLRPGQMISVVGMLTPDVLQQQLSYSTPATYSLITEPERIDPLEPTPVPSPTPTMLPPQGALARIAINGIKVLMVPQSFRYEELPATSSEEQLYANARSASSNQQSSVIVLDVPTQPIEVIPGLRVNPATFLVALDQFGELHLVLESSQGMNLQSGDMITLNLIDLYEAMNEGRLDSFPPTATPLPTLTPTLEPTSTSTPEMEVSNDG